MFVFRGDHMTRTLALACALSAAVALAEETVTGRVTDVTLYRGQALVTRTIPVAADAAGGELVVGDLPQQIVDGSLFAEADEGIEVRAVRLRRRAVGQEPREELREFDERIDATNDDLELTRRRLEAVQKQVAQIDGLDAFVPPTAKSDLARGVLDAATLERITDFSQAEREEIAARQIELLKQQRDLERELHLLQARRAEVAAGGQQTANEAVVFLDRQAAAAGSVRLSYLVNACGWQPAYTVRSTSGRGAVEVEYSGLIQQVTGEDWTDVSLTLSTASPALSAASPGLAPFYVTLERAVAAAAEPAAGEKDAAKAQVAQQYRGLRLQQSEANRQFAAAPQFDATLNFNWAANGFANECQSLELDNDAGAFSRDPAGDAPSLAYRLPGTVSLASRTDQQMLRILKATLDATFSFMATPVLSPYVFREATVKNTSEHDLLGGSVGVYLDGRFVGRTEIPTVARGQTFTIGFGADPQLRASRELVERKEGVQGGNREIGFTYRLSLENFSASEATVSLYDRLPVAERTGEVRVTVAAGKTPLSDDAAYLRTERPKGILRWDVKVPAESTLEKAAVVDYAFTLDHDRNLKLTPARGSSDQQRVEFEQMRRDRLLKK
jgi:hypothetical protein